MPCNTRAESRNYQDPDDYHKCFARRASGHKQGIAERRPESIYSNTIVLLWVYTPCIDQIQVAAYCTTLHDVPGTILVVVSCSYCLSIPGEYKYIQVIVNPICLGSFSLKVIRITVCTNTIVQARADRFVGSEIFTGDLHFSVIARVAIGVLTLRQLTARAL